MYHNLKIGQYGEKLAKDYLINKGYEIICLNYKSGYYEIDIIANIKGKFVFVEVKTLITQVYGSSDEIITPRKFSNFNKGIRRYLSLNNLDPENISIDVITIHMIKSKKIAKIKHYRDII